MKTTPTRIAATLAAMAFCTLQAQATVIILDNFDDDVLTTNTGIGGIGTGFLNKSLSTGGTATELTGDARLHSNTATGASRGIIRSKDSFVANSTTQQTIVTFDVARFLNSSLTFAGVTATADPAGANTANSLYVRFFSSGAATQGGLFFVDNASTVTALATWTWSTLTRTGIYDLNTVLTITSDSYALALSGTNSGISALTGSLTGALASNAMTTAYAFGYEQSGQGTNSYFYLDSVKVEVVPEPSSALLIGLGGLALILRRRRV